MATIKEIAKICNLSSTAVSRALRNESDISKPTIERVQKVASELGYVPNVAAIKLKTNRSFMLGILLEDGTGSGVEHELFAAITNAFMKAARGKGYSVMFISNQIGEQKLSYAEFVRAHGCDAVLVMVSPFSDKGVAELAESGIPVVFVDYLFNNCSSVMSDNARGMRELVLHAHSMGHRKLAFIHGEETNVTRIRLASFYKTCESLSIEVPEEYVVQGKYHDAEAAEQATYELLDLANPPSMIFYSDDFAFQGGRNALEQRGIACPEQISVAGYDGFVFSKVIKPSLVTWKQNTYAIGEKSAELLIDAVENRKTYIPQIVEVHGELLEGQSVKELARELQTV